MSNQAAETNAMQAQMQNAAQAEEKVQQKKKYDEAAVAQTFVRLNTELKSRSEKKAQELAAIRAVKVEDADVDLIASELALSKEAAKQKLQEKKGDVKAALSAGIFLG